MNFHSTIQDLLILEYLDSTIQDLFVLDHLATSVQDLTCKLLHNHLTWIALPLPTCTALELGCSQPSGSAILSSLSVRLSCC